MSERQRGRTACAQRRELIRENGRLRAELHRARREIVALESANANLQVERDAADALMGTAMDEALAASAQ